MAKTHIFSSIGYPGSGKSTFFHQFGTEQGYFHWQSDEVRRRAFARPQHTHAENQILNQTAYYVMEQLLNIGVSCLFDVNLNRREHRRQIVDIAQRHGAEFHLLWFQVPLEVAQYRATRRAEQATGELKAYYDTFGPNFVQKVGGRIEPPTSDEPVIIIDATVSYVQQRKLVLAQL